MRVGMIAKPEHWKHEPLSDATPIPYRATFSAAQFECLKRGLIPRDMEDKWFVYLDQLQLFFHRSWTGQAVYRVALEGRGNEYEVTKAEGSLEVVGHSGPEYHSQLLDFLVRNLLLGENTPFPRPQGLREPIPGLLQHTISGTGFPEKIAAKKQWWQFWR